MKPALAALVALSLSSIACRTPEASGAFKYAFGAVGLSSAAAAGGAALAAKGDDPEANVDALAVTAGAGAVAGAVLLIWGAHDFAEGVRRDREDLEALRRQWRPRPPLDWSRGQVLTSSAAR